MEYFQRDLLKEFSAEQSLDKRQFSYIGSGEIGGKANGMISVYKILRRQFASEETPEIIVDIPHFIVIKTEFFDRFMKDNDLYERASSQANDDRLLYYFNKASLPSDLIGKLRLIVETTTTPLAVRSSSIQEDRLDSPFAGVYATKMLPNNDTSTEERLKKLVEAIKLVYASTFFSHAKLYSKAIGQNIADEKMAVIIQEVVGTRHNNNFYPNISGVARSYNYYPYGQSKPEEGVVNLALGLGKTIVDGSFVWSYSPDYPTANPPLASVSEFLQQTQKSFWAIEMGRPSVHNPVGETEYMSHLNLEDAEYDDTLRHVASTYNPSQDRINIGTGSKGPRIITFGPILLTNVIPLNDTIKKLLSACEEATGSHVEIEFAMTFDARHKEIPRLGVVQVREMCVAGTTVTVSDEEKSSENLLIACSNTLGNGETDDIYDIMFVNPKTFDFKDSVKIAAEIATLNKKMLDENRRYLLVGFGRWGSSESWLGIPVNWSAISGARAIVELTDENKMIDLSQGSHFFHNVANLHIFYYSLNKEESLALDWSWMQQQKCVEQTEFVKVIQIESPLRLKVDGQKREGIILR